MSESRIVLVFAVAAILVTALMLFRNRALGGKALAAVLVSTLAVGGFLFATLGPP
ncbi:hypothetical protein [Magnetospirillum sp. UT-4]|uniref:hypothetical protein n=1 Tax=Magnetospirillum sp. UT-4 TaxID=2681467 RepID=UPI00137C3F6B|nr:hypothetical protein [Magnetospirillum sp. UT-4]CAA7625301.1 Membrane protein [Magnetospirillum sp. UT-4]